MKKLLFLVLAFALSGAIHEIHAQNIGKYLERKAREATKRAAQKADREVTEEINEEVDKSVENVFDNIFESSENDNSGNTDQGKTYEANSQESVNAMMQSLGLNSEPVDVADNYHYSGDILMKVQNWDEDGESQGEIDYRAYMTENQSGFAMKFEKGGQNSVMIFDTKEGAMIILSDNGSSKTGIVTSYEPDSLESAMTSEKTQEYVEDYSIYNKNLKKTGKSKSIAGYKCDEYKYEDEETAGIVWMTDELPADMFAKMINSDVMAASNIEDYGGFVMELDQKDKETNERVFLQVQEVNENSPTSISTEGYEMISLGGNFMQMGEEAEEAQ